MSDPIPIVEGADLSDEERRLIALFDKLEAGQIEFLDEANKRIAELSAVMLGILFAITAVGDAFPPAYLTGAPPARWLMLTTLALDLLALSAGLIGVQPRSYRRHTHNLSAMRRELDRIIAHKTLWFRTATILFFGAALALAGLVVTLVWNA